ncbi:L,D-transpeptidase [Peribacillus frigoritolerans]|uniref:L,D-transpeptidase n=1 Tax=Peribacillus frigoritolerans TaxID=450367 RepID=UPI00336BCBB4
MSAFDKKILHVPQSLSVTLFLKSEKRSCLFSSGMTDKNPAERPGLTFLVLNKRGLGRDNSFTPEGTFPIVNKIKNRPYYKDKIPGGDSRNPLGDRWLCLHALGTNGTTYAIHGNSNPNSIGTYASAGCIRMHNEEFRYLFDLVHTGTSVIILHSNQSFEAIAAANNYPNTVPADSAPVEEDKKPVLLLKKNLLPNLLKIQNQQHRNLKKKILYPV